MTMKDCPDWPECGCAVYCVLEEEDRDGLPDGSGFFIVGLISLAFWVGVACGAAAMWVLS